MTEKYRDTMDGILTEEYHKCIICNLYSYCYETGHTEEQILNKYFHYSYNHGFSRAEKFLYNFYIELAKIKYKYLNIKKG
jgi:hypothetical protein